MQFHILKLQYLFSKRNLSIYLWRSTGVERKEKYYKCSWDKLKKKCWCKSLPAAYCKMNARKRFLLVRIALFFLIELKCNNSSLFIFQQRMHYLWKNVRKIFGNRLLVVHLHSFLRR